MQSTPKPLEDLVHDLETEVEKHKWIESQRAGKDIGLPKASDDWMTKHFPSWKKHIWEGIISS